MKGTVTLALLLAACSSVATSKVAGTYEFDGSALLAAVPAALKEQARQAIEHSLAAAIVLDASGTVIARSHSMGRQAEARGTWKLHGDDITITIRDDAGTEEIRTGKFLDGTITLDIPDGPPGATQLTFRRK